MRRAGIGFCCLLVLVAAGAFAAEEAGKSDVGPSLEYRPPKPILPEPKGPTPAPPVTVFRESFGSSGIGRGSFIRPLDVALGGEGARYVLDVGNNRVQMFDQKDRFILEWGDYGSDERRGQFKRPTTIAVVPDSCSKIGDDIVLVIDTGNNRFQWFRVPCKGDLTKLPNLPVGHAGSIFETYVPPGSPIYGEYGDLGEYGIGIRKFNHPVDIAFEEPQPNGIMLWVLDAGNDRVQRYWLEYQLRTNNGIAYKFVDEITNLTGDRGNLKDQVSVAWSRERSFTYLYLLGAGCALQKFRLGNLPVLEAAWPAVAPESGLCVPARVRYDEEKEYVYVLDSGNSMISIFHRSGNFISAIRGADRVFDEPGGLAFKAASGEFFVADTGNDLVQKFTLR